MPPEADAPYRIHGLDGSLVRAGRGTPDLGGLPKGVYVMNGRKVPRLQTPSAVNGGGEVVTFRLTGADVGRQERKGVERVRQGASWKGSCRQGYNQAGTL